MIPKIHYCYFDLVLLIMNYEEGPDDRANESVLNFFYSNDKYLSQTFMYYITSRFYMNQGH